jgi:hypothetical protein
MIARRYLFLLLLMSGLLAGCNVETAEEVAPITATEEAQPTATTAEIAAATATTAPTEPPPTGTPEATATVTAVPTELPPTDTPEPTLTPTLAPSPTPPGPFTLAQNAPILSPGAHGWDSAFIDPGGMVYHDGLFHMFYNGLSQWPEHVHVGYATSEDGVKWTTMSSTPVFTGEGIDYTGISIFVTSVLVEDDGTWVLYFYTLDSGNFSGPGAIGRAAADSPLGPFTADPEPVLLPGPEGAWDEHAVLNPTVLKTAVGEYRMYYDGNMGDVAANRDRKIGLATSADGINWTKYNIETTTATVVAESDPIFSTGASGSWDRDRITDPNVMQTAAGWLMIYLSSHFDDSKQKWDYSFGLAASEDGISWTRAEDNPFFSQTEKGWNNIYLSTLVENEGVLYLYFDVQASQMGGTAIYMLRGDGVLESN